MTRPDLKAPLVLICTLGLLITTGCGPSNAEPDRDRASVPDAQPVGDETMYPEGIDPANTSDDPAYATSTDNPVRLGLEDEFSGPRASRMYLDALRDANFEPVMYRRVGSMGASPDGNVVDMYEVQTVDGETYEIYIDMYHAGRNPLDQPAPHGLYIQK